MGIGCGDTKRRAGFRAITLIIAFLVTATAARAQGPKPNVPPQRQLEPATEATPPRPNAEMTAADLEAFLDGLVPFQLRRNDIAGAVIVVVKNGKILLAKGFGYADMDKKVPVSAQDTLFRPGSIAKLFTWTAVMQLVEKGKLDLDCDVNAYLNFTIPHTFGKPVTLRNLMTHTPGFEEELKDSEPARANELAPLGTFVADHLPRQIFPPGTVPAYSNYGADLAGYIVQRVSGLPYENYIEENIFRPLGMIHASVLQPLPKTLQPLMSKGYGLASEEAKPFELLAPEPGPDGSMSVSGMDMARFMIAHLQDGQYEGARILDLKTVQLMHTRQFTMDPAVSGMALGFYEENRNGLRIIGHGGDTNYFHSDLHLIPDAGVGLFVSYNSTGKGEEDPRTALWANLLDRYFRYSAPPVKMLANATKHADALSGMYISSRRQ